MRTSLVSMLIAFLISVALTPVVLRIALQRRWFDGADEHRKVHDGEIPRLGGVAIVAAFYGPMLGLLVYETGVGQIWLSNSGNALGLLLGGAVIAALGVYDDVVGCGPKVKFSGQILAAVVVIANGSYIETIDLPVVSGVALEMWLAVPLTIVWLVGLTNAVNLIDGLDGLAGGIALIGLFPFAAVAMVNGDVIMILVTFTLGGAIAGFLVFNTHPARIFMGDTGSMFLGFVLAVTAMQTASKTTGLAAFMLPLLALGVPILDTGLAFTRRVWFGQNPFSGDREHIHHRLMSTGLSHGDAVMAMWLVAALLSVLGLLTALNRDIYSGLALALSAIVAGILMRRIGFLELSELGEKVRNGARIRDYHRRLRSEGAALDQRIHGVHSMEEAVDHLEAYMALVRAVSARLELEHDAVWEWGDPELSARAQLSFPLSVDGHEIGMLHVSLDVDNLPISVAEQRLRRTTDLLATRLQQVARSATPSQIGLPRRTV